MDDENSPYILNENDILVSLTGNVGRVSKMTRANAVLNQRVGRVKINDINKVEHDFLFNILKSARFEESMKNASQGAAQANISNKDILSFVIKYPNLSEQQSIGSFFSTLDHLITLQQRERHFHNSDAKSSFSGSISHHIEVFTAIIFHSYTNTWEQRKFKEIVYRSNDTSNSLELPKLEYEDINSGLGTLNKDISIKKDSRKGLLFKKGDVLFGKLRPYLKNWWLAEFDGIAMGDFWNLRSGSLLNTFLYTYIQSVSFQIVANDTSGTKMPRSDWKLISESTIKFPSISEQQSIGSYFSTLDHLITLQQCKPLMFISLTLKAIS